MHEHEVDGTSTAARSRPSPETTNDLAPDVTRAVAAGRPETLGSAGVLQLQRAAGNAGVQAFVAQRKESAAEDEAESPVHSVVASRGAPLDKDTRTTMESSLGADFGDVEIHTDSAASASAAAVQAHAYTVGNHVVFGEGRYQPGTDEGQRTLAHELTHVVQQRHGPVEGTPAPGGIRLSDPGDRHEREATAAADRVMTTSNPSPSGPDPVPALQRELDADASPPTAQRAAEEEQEEAPPSEAPPEEKEEEMPVSKLDVQRQEGEEEMEEQ